jgi:hypothetical protein
LPPSRIAAALLLLPLALASCSSRLNSARSEFNAPERRPIESEMPLQSDGAVPGEPVPHGVLPSAARLPFDEPSIERIGVFDARILTRGSRKPEGSHTSYGIAASDRDTGVVAWQHFASAPLCKLSYPFVLDGRVFFIEEAAYKGGAEMHAVQALDLKSGTKIWSTPHKGGNAQFFGYIEDADDGKLWIRNYGKSSPAREKFYRVLDAATGKDVAEFSTAVEYESVLVRGGIFYGVDRWAHSLANEAGGTTPDSFVVALDALTGAPIWKSPKQELCVVSRLRLSADGKTLLANRIPVPGSKTKTAVLEFAAGR